ncbi:claudin-4-like [Betta splendens]|uniref:Claudin-4-like n=1 Tax=Betta splendens TaxID=158456 RepID=A0A6P7PVR1_BETSP|nr:claudin-4-like [Betta splendens]
MASVGMQLLASVLCLLGWAGVIISCLLPMWRVTAFVGTTILTSQIFWEGIWMTCVVQSTGQIECKPYESVLALSADMQASRALMVLAIATGGIGLVLAFVGGKCTRFLDDDGEVAKGKVAVAAGAVLIITGLLCSIPTTMVAAVVVRNFYSTIADAQRRELGACLYIGWGASVLFVLGGALFICAARPFKGPGPEDRPSVNYLVVRSSRGSSRAGSYRVPSARQQPPSYGPPSVMSQQDTRPLWEEKQNPRPGSERSRAPSTKSQMEAAEWMESEHSEAPSTKSKLKEAEMKEKLPANSGNEDASNPPRTYI